MEVFMEEIEVLNKLASGEVSLFDVYNRLEKHQLVPQKPKKARFLKVHIDPHDENRATKALLKTIFSIPLPLGLVRMFLINLLHKELSKHDEWAIDKEPLVSLIKYAKDIKITIESSDATIRIQLF
jgi:hypothetical protein